VFTYVYSCYALRLLLLILLVAVGCPRMSDFSRCDYRAAQMIQTVLYGSARTGDYLIVVIKKSPRVPFPGRHDCRWTAACTNETHRNKWVRAHGRLSPPYLCVKPAPPKAISLRKGDTTRKNFHRYGVQRGIRLRNIDFGNFYFSCYQPYSTTAMECIFRYLFFFLELRL
jgi:hypothetical protein